MELFGENNSGHDDIDDENIIMPMHCNGIDIDDDDDDGGSIDEHLDDSDYDGMVIFLMILSVNRNMMIIMIEIMNMNMLWRMMMKIITSGTWRHAGLLIAHRNLFLAPGTV